MVEYLFIFKIRYMAETIKGYEFEGFYFDVADKKERKLFSGNYQISYLKNNDLSLLELLISESPNLVENESIRKTIYPTSNTPSDNIRHSIQNLRNAFSDNIKQEIIQTIHGKGYKFSAVFSTVCNSDERTITNENINVENLMLFENSENNKNDNLISNEQIEPDTFISPPLQVEKIDNIEQNTFIQENQFSVNISPKESIKQPNSWKKLVYFTSFLVFLLTVCLIFDIPRVFFNTNYQTEPVEQSEIKGFDFQDDLPKLAVEDAKIHLNLTAWHEKPSKATIRHEYKLNNLAEFPFFAQRLETETKESPKLELDNEEQKVTIKELTAKSDSCSSNKFGWMYFFEINKKNTLSDLNFTFTVFDTFPNKNEFYSFYIPRATENLEIKITFPTTKKPEKLELHEIKGCKTEGGTLITKERYNYMKLNDLTYIFTIKNPKTNYTYKITWNW